MLRFYNEIGLEDKGGDMMNMKMKNGLENRCKKL